MSTYLTATFSPRPGRSIAAISYATEAVEISRKHFPEATLWRTAVGGSSTMELHLLAPSSSFEESLVSLGAMNTDAQWLAFLARHETADTPFSERARLVSGADAPGFDAPMIRLNATGTARVAGNATYAATPEAFDALTVIAAAGRALGAEHHVVAPVQAGVRPPAVTSILLFGDLRTAGAAMDAMLTDAALADAVRTSSRHVLGRVILEEILV